MKLFLLKLIHLLCILFIIAGIFFKNKYLILIHYLVLWTLIFHWYFNNDICSLSFLESKLRGIPYTKGFIHSIIGPFYNVTNKEIKIATYLLIVLDSFKIGSFLLK